MAVCYVRAQIDTREHREEIFGKVAEMEDKVAIPAPIDRAQLEKRRSPKAQRAPPPPYAQHRAPRRLTAPSDAVADALLQGGFRRHEASDKTR